MTERPIDVAQRAIRRAFRMVHIGKRERSRRRFRESLGLEPRAQELEGRCLLSDSTTAVVNPPLPPQTVTYDLSPPFGGFPAKPGEPNPVFDNIPNLPPSGPAPGGPVAPDHPPNLPDGNAPGDAVPAPPQAPDVTPPVGYPPGVAPPGYISDPGVPF